MFHYAKRLKGGFTLVELAIVLAVAGLMFVGIWRLLASGNEQVRDQSAATLQQQLISAVKGYLASPEGQGTYFGGILAGKSRTLPLPSAANPAGSTGCPTDGNVVGIDPGICGYLSAGFSAGTPNSYGQIYSVRVLRDGTSPPSPPNTYSFMIVTSGGDTIPDTDGGRISAFIGNDGGFIYSAPPTGVCGLPLNQMACGSYGTWSVNSANTYGFGATTSGTIASRTYVSPLADSQLPWLERNLTLQPDPTYSWNTMTTDLYMGGVSTQTPPTYGNIYMAPSGTTTGGGTINLEGGAIRR